MEKEKSSREALDKSKGGDESKALWWQPGLVLFSKLSGWIVGPVILGVLMGKWLDRHFGTEPWLFLFSVGVAFIISMVGLVRESTSEMERIERESSKDKKVSKNNGGINRKQDL